MNTLDSVKNMFSMLLRVYPTSITLLDYRLHENGMVAKMVDPNGKVVIRSVLVQTEPYTETRDTQLFPPLRTGIRHKN